MAEYYFEEKTENSEWTRNTINNTSDEGFSIDTEGFDSLESLLSSEPELGYEMKHRIARVEKSEGILIHMNERPEECLYMIKAVRALVECGLIEAKDFVYGRQDLEVTRLQESVIVVLARFSGVTTTSRPIETITYME